jgi:hypothetical protein
MLNRFSIVVAGLVPATHVFFQQCCEDVDARDIFWRQGAFL